MAKPSEKIQEIAKKIQAVKENWKHYHLNTKENKEKFEKESYMEAIVQYLDEQYEIDSRCSKCHGKGCEYCKKIGE